MQANQSSSMVTYLPLASRDFNSPSCLMWAVLALVGLNEDAPPNGDTLDDTPQALIYRGAVNGVIRTFSPLIHNFLTAVSQEELWERLASINLMVNSCQHYHIRVATPPNVSLLPMWLCTVFARFHRQLQANSVQAPQDAYSASGMEQAVAELIRGFLHDPIQEMLQVVYSQCDLDNPASFEEEFQSTICRAIKDFVEDKMDVAEIHGLVPLNSIGQHIVELIQPALQQWVSEATADFFEEMGFGTRNILNENSAEVNTCLNNFYTRLGIFFSFRSTLLEDFWPEVQVPDHVADHDFARYEEIDWFQHEYELFDGMQDVLLGPAHATLDDVTIPVEADENAELKCGLCQETGKTMRETKVCGHEYCDACLTEQLQVQHECRYKCALCRAEFFPQ